MSGASELIQLYPSSVCGQPFVTEELDELMPHYCVLSLQNMLKGHSLEISGLTVKHQPEPLGLKHNPSPHTFKNVHYSDSQKTYS